MIVSGKADYDRSGAAPIQRGGGAGFAESGCGGADNSSGSATGSWPASTSVAGYYGANYQTHVAGTGASVFTWTLNLPAAGTYEAYARWTSHPNRATNAKYTVNHAGGATVVQVNQEANSGVWVLLGTYSFGAGNATVSLSDEANEYVIADAVMLVPPGAAPSTATWTLAVPATGTYGVYARWTAHPNRATDAKYTVNHAGGAATVTANQEQNSGSWNLLGSFTFNAGNATVTLTDQANGYVIADALMLLPPGAPPNTATWTPNVATAGNYQVYARWTSHPNRATNATYTVSHAAGSTPVTVNQQANGGAWNLLGAYNLAPGTAHNVTLTDQANGFVIADAIRLVLVNTPPTVSISAPAANAVLNLPGPFTLTANAADTDGTVAKVDFYEGATLIGTATSSPYTVQWVNPAPGAYSLTAVATDNANAATASAAVPVTVNLLPTVAITAPAPNAAFSAPASITVTASAADPDGAVTKVDFYEGATLIGTATASPYTIQWTGVAPGSYSLTAIATDNLNTTTASAAVPISVGVARANYFIHVDHLNTPRLVADATGTTVWRWDQAEPFGNNPADENPSGLGAFDLPLRLPGQRYDAETALHYNYFRDYDPSTGRYPAGDPLGVIGTSGPIGSAPLNHPYSYTGSDPVRRTDPTGLLTACQTTWLIDNYGVLGGFFVDLFNLQQLDPRSPGAGSAWLKAGAAAGAKYGTTGAVQLAGNQLAQRALPALASLAGQSIAFAGYCASASLTLAGGGFTTFATTAYQFAVQACQDPITGRQRD